MTGSKILITALAAIIVIGGISYMIMNREPDTTFTNTEVEITPNPTPAPSAKQPGAPVVSTKAESSVSRSTALLNGEVNPNGVQTSYWYEYGETNSLGSNTSPQLIGGGYLTYSAPASVSGLKANTTYYYRIAAQNEFGKVFGEILSLETSDTPPASFVPPTAQTRAATDVAQRSATLEGSTNPNGATTYYWFEYSTRTSLGNATAAGSAGMGNTVTEVSADITNLLPNTTYYYRFNAQNGYGTANGNILSFTTRPTIPPEPPEGEAPTADTDSASPIARTTATLRGKVDPNGSQTTYYFEYGKSTIFGIFTLSEKTDEKSIGAGSAEQAVSQALTGLDPDSTYYYRLVATNSFGTSSGAIFNFRTRP